MPGIFLGTALAVVLGLGSLTAAAADNTAVGRNLYERGRLPDGSELLGKRADGTEVRGRGAACATCHRNSGLGSVEGTVWIPPITAKALFGGTVGGTVVRTDRRYNARISTPHEPYTPEQLGRMIREGLHLDGRSLHTLMPRYSLSPEAMASLQEYLQTLGVQRSPAVAGSVVRLATVITPDIDAAQRQAMRKTLSAFVQQRNVFLTAGLRKKIPAVERKLRSRRTWELVFWELQGTPETWSAQLVAFQKTQPAFALVSGTSNTTWEPMARFCETARVACWFPTLDVAPTIQDGDRYGVYFSRGVATEAEVMAAELKTSGIRKAFVYAPAGAAGTEALQALRAALGSAKTNVEVLTESNLDRELAEARKDAAVLIWGNRQLAERLARLPAPRAAVFWVVGSDPGMTDAFPPAWQKRLTRVDRFEQTAVREANLQRFREWAKLYEVPVVDERLQAEAFFSAGFLAATFTDILNNLDPLYLVERAQDTLSMREAERVQMEVNSMMMGGGSHGPAAPAGSTRNVQRVDLTVQRARQGTTIYSRLSLGPGQHFASQGAFLIGPNGTRWSVPGTPGTAPESKAH